MRPRFRVNPHFGFAPLVRAATPHLLAALLAFGLSCAAPLTRAASTPAEQTASGTLRVPSESATATDGPALLAPLAARSLLLDIAVAGPRLVAVGVADGAVQILASNAPAKDSQAASILAIMGGGEEVSL